MAQIQIKWETVTKVVKDIAVTSADDEKSIEEKAKTSLFAQLKQPTVVFVEGGGADFDFEKLNDQVFKNEKVGLAMKAFRALKISPQEASEDLLIGKSGKTTPRVLVIDPAKEKIKVLESKKIKAGALYKAMKSVAGAYYKEKLDKVVKGHLKLLNEQDKLYGEAKTLQDKIQRLKADGDKKGAKKLKALEEEMAELNETVKKLADEQLAIWKLTPKKKKTA